MKVRWLKALRRIGFRDVQAKAQQEPDFESSGDRLVTYHAGSISSNAPMRTTDFNMIE